MDDESTGLTVVRRRVLLVTGAESIGELAGCATIGDTTVDSDDLLPLPHGVAVGDTTSESAVFWTRLSGPGVVIFEYTAGDSFDDAERVECDPTSTLTVRRVYD